MQALVDRRRLPRIVLTHGPLAVPACQALNLASHFEDDDVIDLAETRAVITQMLRATLSEAPRADKKRPRVDPW